MLYPCQIECFNMKMWIYTHIKQATRHQVSKYLSYLKSQMQVPVQADRGGIKSVLAGSILVIAS